MENNTLIRVAGASDLYMERLSRGLIDTYLQTGRQAYTDHYCHLWPQGNPHPYLSRNFIPEKVTPDLDNPDSWLWVVRAGGQAAGICKWVVGKPGGPLPGKPQVFLEKIYFKKAFTGMGLGGHVMDHLLAWSRNRGAAYLWLEAMQKGPALSFYQQRGFRILGETQVPYPEVLPGEKAMWVLGRETAPTSALGQ
ncbi:GNAT family N-acetyltransferase [Robiginitalea sp. M366]|uniref:GNAT family N-acetyltransferase n=1 Tax=Robiginitalea aestuariiviva TaxID=3036903 RepID=UPI00240E3404|nr:GNAT family N-acetyltransferase [Robiginitalea aestuariiviva]MDG1572322.1 GNAT family N-acetyltransferase [Robiginitalea aestuariiviva]